MEIGSLEKSSAPQSMCISSDLDNNNNNNGSNDDNNNNYNNYSIYSFL